MLWFIGFTCTWYGVWITVGTEISAGHLRDLTLSVAAVLSNIVALLVALLTPYMQNPEYGNLGAKIGFLCKSDNIAELNVRRNFLGRRFVLCLVLCSRTQKTNF